MLETKPVRSYQAVRDAIDLKRGAPLNPVESVVWSLEQLLGNLFEFSLHLWDQRHPDGPRTVAAIAEAACESDPLIADLLRSTAR